MTAKGLTKLHGIHHRKNVRSGLLLAAFLVGLGLTATETVQLTIGSWRPGGELAGERARASAALLEDGRVLFAGGSDAAGPSFSAEIFDPASGFFTGAAPLTVARSAHSSTLLGDGRILVAGGWSADGEVVASAEIYDPATDQWTLVAEGGEMLEARAGHSATLLVDGRVVIAGGEDSSGPLATIEIFDPASGAFDSWGSLAAPRSGHAAARLADERVLIVGGWDGVGSVSSTEIFDAQGDVISDGPPLNHARSGHSVTTLLNGDVLVAGGSSGGAELGSAEIYDAALGAFVPLPSGLISARQGHLAFLLPSNNSVLIVGGSAQGESLAAVELYRPWSDTFVGTGWLGEPRAGAAGGAWGGGVVVGGGEGSSSSELYGFATLETDRDDYAPGDSVTITGSGWLPGQEVALWLREEPDTHEFRYLSAFADGNGNIFNDEYLIEEHDLGVRFYLTGSDGISEAQITFTDARVWSLTISPTSTNVSQTATYTLDATNNSSASEVIGCVKVTIPAGFTPVGSPTTTTPSWSVGRVGQELTATANSNGVRRAPGQSVVISQTAQAPASTAGSPFTWTGFASTLTNCNVSQAFPAPSNDHPTVAVTSRSTSTTVSLSPTTVVVDQASTVTVTVTDTASGTKVNPTGTVALSSSVGSDVFGGACELTSTPSIPPSGISTCTTSVTPATASLHTITASFSATAVHAASGGNAGLTVNKKNQTITFGALPGKTFGDAAFSVAATASSGLAVSFSSLTTPVCTVSGSTVTIAAAGTCTIRASQAGNGAYNPAPDVDQSFTVAKATPTATLQVNNSPQTYDGTGKSAAVSAASSSVPGSVTNVLTGGAASQTNAGTYPVTADFVPTDAANYNSLIGLAAGNFTIDKATPSATLQVDNSPQTYDGTGKSAAVSAASSSVPGSAANVLTGGAASQTNAGTYAVTADFVPTDAANYNSLPGLAAGDFTIDKATPSATLQVDNSPQTYDGTGKSAAVSVASSSVSGSVANVLTGGAASQTNAGTYAVTADFVPTDAANYNSLPGLAAGDFTIDMATPSATLQVDNSPQTYDGTGKSAAVSVASSSVPGSVANVLTGGAASQTNAGTYAVTADFVPTDAANYNSLPGLAAGDFTIDMATPSATLQVDNSPQTYDGTGKSAVVSVASSSVAGSVANVLTGGAASQTNAGTYAVTADFVPTDAANYNSLPGLAAGDFTIDKATPSATLQVDNSPQTYDGTGKSAVVSVASSSVPGSVANVLTGGAASQTNAGTYAVTADFVPTDAANYNSLAALSAGDFTIDKATPTATLQVDNSPQTYDGTGKAAAVSVASSSVAGSVANVLTGGAASQTNAGTYAVTANFVPDDSANYNSLPGLSAGDFTIDKATPTATLQVDNSPQTYDGTGKSAAVSVASSSVAGSVANILTGGAASQTDASTYAVTADFVPTDAANYNSLPGLAAGDFTIDKATPSATLQVDNSPQTYDGTGKAAAVSVASSSVPGSVANILTGGAASQTNAGTYAVTADFVPTDAANYNSLPGLAAGDFTIDMATPSATLQVDNSPQTYDGTGKSAVVSVASSSVPGSVANVLTGGAASQTNAGTYAVTADFVPTDAANYNSLPGLAAGDFTIDKATPSATLQVDNSPQTYDGTGKSAAVSVASSSVAGSVANILTGGAASQTDAGTYAVTADFVPDDSANYNSLLGLSAGDFTISPASTTTVITNAAALASTPTVIDEGYAVNWSVTVDAPGGGTPTGTVTVSGGSGCSAPVAAGTCTVTSTTAGSKTLVATYVSDTANFNGSGSGGATHQVNTRPSSTGVSLLPTSVVVGQPSDVKVTVSDSAGAGTASAPAGSVSFSSSVGSDVFSSTSCTLDPEEGTDTSSCSVTVTPSSASVHTISASYGGSGTHSSSGGSAGLTVSPAGTTTTLGSAPSPSSFGALVTFTATVTVNAPGAGTPTGSVTFKEGATVLAAGVPLVAGQAGFSISSLTAGLHTITVEYSGSSNFTASSGNKAHTVGQAATTASVSVTPNPQQYSDRVEFVATLSPASIEGLAPATSVTFKIGTQTMGTVALVVDGGLLKGTLSSVPLVEPVPFGTAPTGQLEPGVRTVTAVFGGVDPNFSVGSPTSSLTITREDASADYTGAEFVSTSCATCSNATVTLATTVRDISVTSPADANPGDVRNAKVKFVNLDAGSALLCSAPVGLVNASDSKVGTATCNWTTSIGNTDSASVTVGVVVEHYYTGQDQTVVTISKPVNNMITGGGYLVLSNSAGIKAGDFGLKNNWGFNVKYNKSGKNLQGNINAIVRRTEAGVPRVYQIKGNVMTSLAVSTPPGAPATAVFNGKANLQDITDPTNPIPVDGNATLQVTMTDKGEPGANDQIGITVWDKNGGLWFSSHWSGIQTVEKVLGGGNLVVR